jgi:NitT/TauT family transport system substrate-binding protein
MPGRRIRHAVAPIFARPTRPVRYRPKEQSFRGPHLGAMTSARPLSRQTFVAGAAAALAAVPLIGRAADPVVIRAGTIPADVTAVITYAANLGYFKNAGLDVQISMMQSGPVIAPAVIGGSLDVGAANVGSISGAHERGLPLLIFAPGAAETPASATDVIMVKTDSPIKTAADMNGKTFAIVATKTIQHAAVLQWVDKHGGDSKSLKFIEVPFPEMLGALDAGRVDVAIPSEPFTSIGRPTHRTFANVYSSMPPFMIFGFFATQTWLDANAGVAMRFAGAIRQAAVWANAHPRDSATMLAAFMKLDPAVAATMARATYATSLEASAIQPGIDVMVQYGFLQKPMDAADVIWKAPK